jgi:hypothetical protein
MKKEISKDTNPKTTMLSQTPSKPKPYPCESCNEQCSGHGGGVACHDGGCLCNDGTFLECL